MGRIVVQQPAKQLVSAVEPSFSRLRPASALVSGHRKPTQVPPAVRHADQCHRLVAARVAAVELETERAAEDILAVHTSDHANQGTFDWRRQWYPVALLDYLDPKVPHPLELLGERLVLWRDAKQRWCCFEDKCPHRLAPLSEGRIEPSDGTLMCSYHGWRFTGEGRCTDVPQSIDATANAAACASPRSCAVARPLKVLQGMVFVWGSSGPNGAAESLAKPVLGMQDMEQTEGVPKRDIDGRPCFNNIPVYFRELPYGWEVLVENLVDPSHLPFAHSGVLNRRDDPNAGYFRMGGRPEGTPADPDVIAVAGHSIRPVLGGVNKRVWQLDPPARITWTTLFDEQSPSGTPWITQQTMFCVPTGTGRSSLILQGWVSAEGSRETPRVVKMLYRRMPLWAIHVFLLHNTFDGDIKILYMQERILAENTDNWRRGYYMPAQADRLVAAFRKWLDTRGGGGPPTALRPGAPLPSAEQQQESFLNRLHSHTRHCPSCSGAMKGFQRLQMLAAAAGALCMLALSSVLGRGAAPLSAAPVGLLLGALVSLGIWTVATKCLQLFTYVSYNHSEK